MSTVLPVRTDSFRASTILKSSSPSRPVTRGVASSRMQRKKCAWRPSSRPPAAAPFSSESVLWPLGSMPIFCCVSTTSSSPPATFLRTVPSRSAMMAPFVPTMPREVSASWLVQLTLVLATPPFSKTSTHPAWSWAV